MSGDLAFTKERIITDLLMLPGMLIGLSFHEFGHAYVSDKLGDPTPKMQGRVTLNPVAHIDPVGFIALIFAGFGWGKAVEIDPRYYKNKRGGEIAVGLAGVTANLIIIVLFTIIDVFLYKGIIMAGSGTTKEILVILQDIMWYGIIVNVMLMIFNLLPIPPLDGFGIITNIFDLRKYSWYYTVYNNGNLILVMLIFFGATRVILSPLLNGIVNVIASVQQSLFMLIA